MTVHCLPYVRCLLWPDKILGAVLVVLIGRNPGSISARLCTAEYMSPLESFQFVTLVYPGKLGQ